MIFEILIKNTDVLQMLIIRYLQFYISVLVFFHYVLMKNLKKTRLSHFILDLVAVESLRV